MFLLRCIIASLLTSCLELVGQSATAPHAHPQCAVFSTFIFTATHLLSKPHCGMYPNIHTSIFSSILIPCQSNRNPDFYF
ncbi:hypothetical protein BD289DRAFT_447508 [Coniella lustricola]|uniref:Secreted protein n=1 Tax=Coniella lustricola TaxID=2025994 RepID=A0A2T2ZT21_9PEZI|nr:hypothetical protein BD289DRAFT_447508 [Coniella lustricola]